MDESKKSEQKKQDGIAAEKSKRVCREYSRRMTDVGHPSEKKVVKKGQKDVKEKWTNEWPLFGRVLITPTAEVHFFLPSHPEKNHRKRRSVCTECHL